MTINLTPWMLALVVAGLVCVHPAHGEWRDPDAVVGLRGGVTLLTQDPAEGTDSDLGPAVAVDVLFTVRDAVMLGVSFLGASTEIDGLSLGSTTVDDTVEFSTGLLTLEYHAAFRELSPYAVLGIGATHIDLGPSTAGCTTNVIVFAVCTGTLDDDDVEGTTVFAAKVGAGLEYFLNDHLVLNTELAWLYAGPADIHFSAAGAQATRTLDLSRLTALVGLRYYFQYDQ